MSPTTTHPPGHRFLAGNGRPDSDDQVPAALLSLCEWWVGLSLEERSGLLEAAEWAEIDRKVDAAVLAEATWKTTSTLCPIEPTFAPTDEEGQL